ncbi:MAG: hypothetical protein IKP88_15000 [Lachnospiraceae bacterium]|nr:hypothetical protein [Lachnospiraceae bacterium]
MKKKDIIFVSTAVVLCLAAAVGGYKGSRYIADSITVKAEQNAEKAGLFKPRILIEIESRETEKNTVNGDGSQGPEEKITVIRNSRPLSIIYVTDFETGKIEKIALEIFDTINMSAEYIFFDTDISYTMTASLYRSLANGNVLLPQTIRLKELYGYYGADAAFDAGRRIVSELIGREVDHYISLSKEDVPEDFMMERVTVLGMIELHSAGETRLTDISEEEEAMLRDYGEKFRESDIKSGQAPVIRRNESCFIDVAGLWEILQEK